MLRRCRLIISAWVSFLGFFSVQAFSQSIGGSITGFVGDPTGPVPQAEVRITNVATGQVRFWLTDDQGRYELREVPAGLYKLEISKDGYTSFSTPASDNLHLQLAQTAKVADITLEAVRAGETRVVVKAANVGMTNPDTATLGTAFDENQVRDLPLSARDVNNLALLASGVVSVNSFNIANTLVAFAVNGSRGRDNNFIIDSVDNNDPLFGGAGTQFTDKEIFSEFHILTGQFQAEYGHNSGSVVNVITKQGGRLFHGSLFWFNQNDAFNGMTKVEKQSGLTKSAQFYENQLGATVSGPIKRGSAWFFVSYQWDRARNDLSSQYPVIVTLPTAQGLSLLKAYNATNPSPTLTTFLADPLVETLPSLKSPCGQLPNETSVLPALNPCTMTAPLSPSNPFIPTLPNGTAIPFGTYLVPKANVTDLRDHEAFTRIDQKIGEHDNLFARYLFDDFLAPLAPSASPAEIGTVDSGVLPEWRNFLANRTQNFGSAWTHALNQSLNELRLSYSRISSRIGSVHANSGQGETPALTISDDFAPSPISSSLAAGEEFSLGSTFRPAQFSNNIYQLQENYSIARGIHDIKLGGDLNFTRSVLNQIVADLGIYSYGSFSDFVSNEAGFALLQFGNLNGKGGEALPLQEIDQSYFVQDSIHISPNFTLNLGVRYENYGPAFNAVVDRSESTALSPQRIHRVFTNFAPRLGFAWGLGQRTVIKGGYGIFYNPIFQDIALLAWQNGPISPVINASAGSNQFPLPPFVGTDATIPSSTDCLGNAPPPGSSGATPRDCTPQYTVSKNLSNPFVHEASLGLQTQVFKDFLVEASYVGSRGTRLFQEIDANPPGGPTVDQCTPTSGCFGVIEATVQPNRGIIAETTNGGFSTYNSLQFVTTKRIRGVAFWDGFQFSSAYTWSHMIDNASDAFGPGILQRLNEANSAYGGVVFPIAANGIDPTPFAQNPADTRDGEKGNSSFDSRNRLALSLMWAPHFPGKANQMLLGNWQANGILTAQSGLPFSPLSSTSIPCSGAGYGYNFNFTGLGSGFLGSARPDIGNPHAPEDTVALINNLGCVDPNSTVPGVAEFAREHPLVPGAGPYITPSGQTVDPSTVRFVQVPYGTFGDAGRNILTGPASVNLDLSLSKTILLGERFKLQLRAEAFDLLNRENPGPFAGNTIIAADQQVSSTLFRQMGSGPIPFLNNPASPSPASLNGLTPENAIDASEPSLLYGPTVRAPFLSKQYLTTSSRRVQFSLRFSF